MGVLEEQINKTLRNLERGEVQREDRIFLNHVLEEFQHMVDMSVHGEVSDDVVYDMIGSTRELVEDGLNWEM